MKKTGIIIALILVVGLAGLAFAFTRDNTDNNDSNMTTNTTDTTTSTDKITDRELEEDASQNQRANSESTIEYTNDGFSPGELTVKAGATVTIKNSSSRPLQFSSDEHPEHTNNPELNLSTLSPGESQMLTVTAKGTHGVHNHLNETHTATLIVE